MNKFLIVILAIILISASAFRTRAREDAQTQPTQEDLDKLKEVCDWCINNKPSTRLQDDQEEPDCQYWGKICKDVADHMNSQQQ